MMCIKTRINKNGRVFECDDVAYACVAVDHSQQEPLLSASFFIVKSAHVCAVSARKEVTSAANCNTLLQVVESSYEVRNLFSSHLTTRALLTPCSPKTSRLSPLPSATSARRSSLAFIFTPNLISITPRTLMIHSCCLHQPV